MSDTLRIPLSTESHTEALGNTLARNITPGSVIYLWGDLGVGKTRLSRAILHGLGHKGVVKSPTYTLVEPYNLSTETLYHFDLYRLADPQELEFMGIEDYFDGQALVLVEWPDKGRGILPAPDLHIRLSFAGSGRQALIEANSPSGRQLLEKLKNNL